MDAPEGRGAGIRSTKISAIVDILRRIPEGEKVLVFSAFTSALDLLAEACASDLPRLGVIKVDGSVKGRRREEALSRFRTDPGVRALLLSYGIGSLGLNLTEATHVICVEPWWTNATHDQAESRAWRTGQTDEVHVHNVYVRGSVEERVLEVRSEKADMERMVLGKPGDGGPRSPVQLDKRTLGRMLGLRP